MPRPIKMQAQHQTLYAFQGNPFQRQLTFLAGEAIILITVQNEWAYGTLVSNKTSGWFPTSYIQSIIQATTPSATIMDRIFHSSNNPNSMAAYPNAFDLPTGKGATMMSLQAHQFPDVAYYDDDTGFAGPIMGGSAPTTPTAWNTTMTDDSTNTAPSDTAHNNKSWLQKTGTNISAVAQKTGSSASAVASKTTSKISSAATSTGSFLSRGLKKSSLGQTRSQQQVYMVQTTTTQYGLEPSRQQTGTNSSAVAHKTDSSASVDASSPKKTGSFFSRGIKNSSIGQTRPQQQVYTVQTTTYQTGGGSGTTTSTGGAGSSTTTHQTVVTTHQGGRSGRERVAGSVGTYATYSMAMNAMSGNIGGVIRSGAVAAGAFAIEGNTAEQRNQQSNYPENK